MGAKTAITEAQYLRTSYPDLDKEYRDGDVLERTLPDYLHSKTQSLLSALFIGVRETLHLYPGSELRLQVRRGLYRIPDLCVFHPHEPAEAVPSTPPFIVVEILSPDDRMAEVRSKLEEYKQWGVAHVWLVDPHSKRMYSCDSGFAEVPTLSVPELSLEVTPADIFE
ncbi:MAG: Uma2 family endonuclease [Acidobacteriota bacterium]